MVEIHLHAHEELGIHAVIIKKADSGMMKQIIQ